MFNLSGAYAAIQQANAQAAIARHQEAVMQSYCEEQQRQSDQSGAVNLVLKDGVYALPEQIEHDYRR